MKKLLSVLAVAAIVTSAFAFTTKALTFCVYDATLNDCKIQRDKVEDNVIGANFLHYPLTAGWNGTHAGCTAATPTDCDIAIKLKNN